MEDVTVAVHYNQRPSNQDVEALVEATQPNHYFVSEVLPLVLLNTSVDLVDDAAALAGVVAVDYLGPVEGLLDYSMRAVKVRQSSDYSPNTAWDSSTARGLGMVVAVFDYGIDDNHESLRDKIITGGIFLDATNTPCTNPTDNTIDNSKHGTGVAGIAVGTGGPLQSYIRGTSCSWVGRPDDRSQALFEADVKC